MSDEIEQEGEAPHMDVVQGLTAGRLGHLIHQASTGYSAEG
jgi:hypothetical protein